MVHGVLLFNVTYNDELYFTVSRYFSYSFTLSGMERKETSIRDIILIREGPLHVQLFHYSLEDWHLSRTTTLNNKAMNQTKKNFANGIYQNFMNKFDQHRLGPKLGLHDAYHSKMNINGLFNTLKINIKVVFLWEKKHFYQNNL